MVICSFSFATADQQISRLELDSNAEGIELLTWCYQEA